MTCATVASPLVMNARARTVPLGLLVATLLACESTPAPQEPPPAGPAAREPASKATPPADDPLADPDLLNNKLAPYIACVQATRPGIYRHYRWFDANVVGARSKQPVAHVTPGPESMAACERAEREGPHLHPRLPRLEDALTSYTAATSAYLELVAPLEAVVKRGRAKEIAAQQTALVAAFDAWDAANLTLDEAIERHQAEADEALLARLKARGGEGYAYHLQGVMIAARTLARCLADTDPADPCSGDVDRLDRARGALAQYVDAHADETPSGAAAFDEYAAAFRSAAATLEGDAALPEVMTHYNAMVAAARALEESAK